MEKIVPCRKVHCGVRQGRGPGPIFTVRKRSCGKVMSLHLCVSHSVHRGVSTSVHAGIHTPPWAETPWADTPTSRQTPRAWAWTRTPPRQRSPWADTPSPSPSRPLLLRTVRILLECIMVFYCAGQVPCAVPVDKPQDRD